MASCSTALTVANKCCETAEVSSKADGKKTLHKSDGARAVRENFDSSIGTYEAQVVTLIDPDQSPDKSQELAERAGFQGWKGLPMDRGASEALHVAVI